MEALTCMYVLKLMLLVSVESFPSAILNNSSMVLLKSFPKTGDLGWR